MNIALQYRDQIGQLSGSLQNELDQLAASIGAGWNTEHDADGHHVDITATTCACGQLKLRGFTTLDLSASASGATIVVPAGVSFVAIVPPAVGTFEVWGIQQVGQKHGDVLYLMRAINFAGVPSLRSRANSTFGAGSTPIGAELVLATDPLSGDRPVPLVFLPYWGTGNADAWVMVQ